jgi:hypothetical protein
MRRIPGLILRLLDSLGLHSLSGDLAEEIHADRAFTWVSWQVCAAILAGVVTQIHALFQRSQSMKPVGQLATSFGRSVVLVLAVWFLAFGMVQTGERLGGWPASEAGQLIAFAIGTLLSVVFRARLVAYLCAAMLAYTTSELVVHAVYGIRAAQGAPTHFAVMGAGMMAVMLGAAVTSLGRGKNADPVSR